MMGIKIQNAKNLRKISNQIFLTYIILFLSACQNSSSDSIPIMQNSLPTANENKTKYFEDILDSTKEIILSQKPDSATELPRINIASEPENILNLTGFVVPKTAIFEMRLLNSGKTHLITHYSWQVIKLGIPLISEDQTIHESTGARLSYTFREKGRFRIIGTVRTSNNEVSSSSIIVVGLT